MSHASVCQHFHACSFTYITSHTHFHFSDSSFFFFFHLVRWRLASLATRDTQRRASSGIDHIKQQQKPAPTPAAVNHFSEAAHHLQPGWWSGRQVGGACAAECSTQSSCRLVVSDLRQHLFRRLLPSPLDLTFSRVVVRLTGKEHTWCVSKGVRLEETTSSNRKQMSA